MRTFDHIPAIKAFVKAAHTDGKSVGFIPTMGALHEGHLTLMRKARGECDVVVVSIFVNPTQFAVGEDFDRYPRDLLQDSKLAQRADVDALFVPNAKEIYPPGFKTYVNVSGLGDRWQGELRPGHFTGVATICAKLFNIVLPDRAYFGQKDYQQFKIVERLVADLNMPLTVMLVPTVREPDGLAMSSRNRYLSPSERKAATVLYRALKAAEERFAAGERRAAALKSALVEVVESEPAARLDYAAIADADTLDGLESVKDRAVALIAVRIGSTRLIDNTLLGSARGK
jgi:pantoate--beta-alanine ligase